MITQKQIDFYFENGYLLIDEYASFEETELLKSRMNVLLDDIQTDHASIFSTEKQTRTSDQYFLESGDKIRCFFEDGLDATDTSNKKQINKIGHALHDLDPVYKSFSYQEKLLSLSKKLKLEKAAIIQSQYIFKSPTIGGKVSAHTDSTFIYTDPQTCTAVWIALEDAKIDNACLWVLPKSHKNPIKERFIRNQTNDGTIFIDQNKNQPEWNLDELIPVEAKQGNAVLLHGSLVHLSYLNKSDRSRNAYVMHLIDMKAHYPSDNWLQRSSGNPLRSIEENL